MHVPVLPTDRSTDRPRARIRASACDRPTKKATRWFVSADFREAGDLLGRVVDTGGLA